MKFEDHFSKNAAAYAKYRPCYPAELFVFLAEQSPARRLCWDCASGNGQAAQGLVDYFERVIATDASAEQIARAEPHERITYRVEPAEETSLAAGSVDLATAAVAVHWFDFDRFYNEVRRVLKPGGVLAVWTYHRPVINPAMDDLIVRFEMDVLGKYWPERIHYLREHYQTLPFPFEEIPARNFDMNATWTLDQLLGFLNSWSAVRRYQGDRGEHPFAPIWEDLHSAWGDPDTQQTICWPLYMRLGRVSE